MAERHAPQIKQRIFCSILLLCQLPGTSYLPCLRINRWNFLGIFCASVNERVLDISVQFQPVLLTSLGFVRDILPRFLCVCVYFSFIFAWCVTQFYCATVLVLLVEFATIGAVFISLSLFCLNGV